MLILSLWSATEPIILSIFGNTLGKSLLNTRIRSITGEPLDYLTAFRRSFYIALSGMGLGIPFFSFLFSLRSHFSRPKSGLSPWDLKCGTVILYGETSIGRFLFTALLPDALFCTGFIFGKI
ncbi:RDD family protein [Neobacillus terrae]|uniref:RDD family protein n=1 Tax=Neobacillus terrae TaxID=3034837 RepID=UPI001409120B|nr:RDD family protein [Neobacillus terrae]